MCHNRTCSPGGSTNGPLPRSASWMLMPWRAASILNSSIKWASHLPLTNEIMWLVMPRMVTRRDCHADR